MHTFRIIIIIIIIIIATSDIGRLQRTLPLKNLREAACGSRDCKPPWEALVILQGAVGRYV
jgi:hypothetical protein